jgi:hypothetical protein
VSQRFYVEDRLVYVRMPYATYGLIIRNGRVVEAPPIARWMVGRPEHEMAAWITGKGGTGTVVGAL